MKRKILAMLLAMAMLLSLSAAHAKGEALEMSDVPGMTAPGIFPLVTEPVTLTIGLVPQGNVIDYDTNRFTTWMEEKTGVNIEFFYLPTTDTAQKFNLMVAANEKLPDIMLDGVTDMVYYGQSGYLLSLNDYFEKYAYYYNETIDKYAAPDEKAQLLAQSYCYDGNQYCFTYCMPEPTNDHENIMYINQKWLEAVNREVPTTLDELYEVLIAFRDDDPNGNGIKDEIPIMGYNSFDTRGDVVGNLINSFIYYPGGGGADSARCIVKDGVVSSPVIAEEYREALRYCKKLYDEGLITEVSFTQTREQLKAAIDLPSTETTIVGTIATHFWSGVCGFTGCSEEYNKVMEYVALPPLTGPEGVCWAMQQHSGYNYRAYITNSCEHPEVAFRFLDAMCNPEISWNYRFGIQGETWDYAEEGELNAYGKQAFYKQLLDEMPWVQESQNMIWRLENLRLQFSSMMNVATETDNPYAQYRNDTLYKGVSMRMGHQPEEFFANPVWNEEEYEIVSEYGSMLRETSNEWRTMFVMGQKDLDKDWQEYLSQMEALGLNEYLQAAQNCYDRMSAN